MRYDALVSKQDIRLSFTGLLEHVAQVRTTGESRDTISRHQCSR